MPTTPGCTGHTRSELPEKWKSRTVVMPPRRRVLVLLKVFGTAVPEEHLRFERSLQLLLPQASAVVRLRSGFVPVLGEVCFEFLRGAR